MRTNSIITNGRLAKSKSRSWHNIELLCTTAKKGLANYYFGKGFLEGDPNFDNDEDRLKMAWNLRYIIMAQIGIRRWLHSCSDNTQLPDFWEYILSRSYKINNAGDLGLAIWAGVESNADDCRTFAEKLVSNWGRLGKACNAVELAWVLQGVVRFSQRQPMTNGMTDLLKDACHKLMGLYCRDTALFAKHRRRSFREAISRRIACFADQVYPILALASYGRHFNDSMSVDAAVAVADTICRLQGPRGQWWWHYDVNTGIVAEEYPVFSVHQDGMAPMALLAIDKVAGTNHRSYVEKGLTWLNKQNELNVTMLMAERGVIWRNIHRREVGKMYRLARSVLLTAGCDRAHRLAGRNLFGYAVNKECRPYHLGWILYAWANHKTNQSMDQG